MEATDSFFDAKFDRIEYAINERSDRTFAFDEFGPGVFVPQPVRAGSPRAGPAGFRRPVTAPTEHLLPRLPLGRRRHPLGCQPAPQGHRPTWAALKNIRAARPDGAPIKLELCFTPTNASWANPIKAHFGPLRQFTVASSHHPHHPHHPNHTVQTREAHRYLRWRNQNARHPDVLAAQRRERARIRIRIRIRSEKSVHWGGRPLAEASGQPVEHSRTQP